MYQVLLPIVVLYQTVSAAIDPFDSTVVRRILDNIGWNNVAVESVVSSPIAVTGTTVVRVTSLNLSLRTGLDSIRQLPSQISQLPELTTLSLKGNALSTLPDTLSTLYKLSRLDISNNRFTTLPPALKGLSLQVLIADYNQLEALPEWIGQLSRLQSVSIVGNRLTTLPAEIIRCTSLATLSLDSNRIDSIPVAATEVTTFKVGISGNRLCSVDETVARWLDAVQLTADWRTTQICELSITSIFTEALTGTVVHVTGALNELITSCKAVELAPSDTASLSWFTLQRVVKAVSITFADCFTGADSNVIIVTFAWGDVKAVAPDGQDLAIYYAAEGTSRYLGGTIDTIHKTISIRTSRAGDYLLTLPFSVAVQPQIAAPAQSKVPVQYVVRNGNAEIVVSGNSTRDVRIRLFDLGGRVLSESTVTIPGGTHSVGLGTLFGKWLQSYVILEIRSGEFQSVHRLPRLR